MDLEYLLIPAMESDDSTNEFHIGTLSEFEKYRGKAKKLDKKYYQISGYDAPLILLVDDKTDQIIAEAEYSYFNNGIKLIEGFIVDSDYRNQGYGEKFLKWCIKNLGINTLEVAVDNTTAIRLYKKCGFKVTDTIKKKKYTILVMQI